VVTGDADVGDGVDRVTARSYVDGLVMFPDGQAGTRANGYYDDELVATDEGWKIARRRFTAVLIQFFPEGTRPDPAASSPPASSTGVGPATPRRLPPLEGGADGSR
jgi:hypothetical protein